MKYVKLDNKNKILGWYDSHINKDIPKSAMPIPDEKWQEALWNNANYYKAGIFVREDSKDETKNEFIRIKKINKKANEIILDRYPLWKQINITNSLDGYCKKDTEEMCLFINRIRKISNIAIDKKKHLNEIDWDEDF